jgi:NTE family protein
VTPAKPVKMGFALGGGAAKGFAHIGVIKMLEANGFEPVTIGSYQYVDGGVVSPVPVDAARQLGADFVIAVDISSKASGKRPDGMLGIVNQSIAIMGQRLGEQELARADVVVRPKVLDIGAADFTQRNQAILEGEKAALAVLPQIRAAMQKLQAQRLADARATAAKREAALAPAPQPACKDEGWRWNPLKKKDDGCVAASR